MIDVKMRIVQHAALVAGMVIAVAALLHAQSEGETDTGFAITLMHPTGKPAGVLAEIVTTATYPCEGYRLTSQVRWAKDTIDVHIIGLIRPLPCVYSSSEATGSAYLGILTERTYILRISYRATTDIHRVMFAGKKIRTVPLHASFTTLRGM